METQIVALCRLRHSALQKTEMLPLSPARKANVALRCQPDTPNSCGYQSRLMLSAGYVGMPIKL